MAQLKSIIETSLDDDKAEDIISIDLAGKTDIADFMIIASGRSQRHVLSLAQNVEKHLNEIGHAYVQVEGKDGGDWVLVDTGDVIIHIFRPEIREHYNLEKMWAVDLPEFQAAV